MWRYFFALMVLSAALAETNAEKRAEISPMPFVLSTRYGRSPPRVMMPRNDRFFLGSRYGKRSEVSVGSSLPPPGAPTLVCEYTGVYSLYRCKVPARAPYDVSGILFTLSCGSDVTKKLVMCSVIVLGLRQFTEESRRHIREAFARPICHYQVYCCYSWCVNENCSQTLACHSRHINRLRKSHLHPPIAINGYDLRMSIWSLIGIRMLLFLLTIKHLDQIKTIERFYDGNLENAIKK